MFSCLLLSLLCILTQARCTELLCKTLNRYFPHKQLNSIRINAKKRKYGTSPLISIAYVFQNLNTANDVAHSTCSTLFLLLSAVFFLYHSISPCPDNKASVVSKSWLVQGSAPSGGQQKEPECVGPRALHPYSAHVTPNEIFPRI